MSKNLHKLLDSVLIVFGIMVIWVVWLYRNVLAIELWYLFQNDHWIQVQSSVEQAIVQMFEAKDSLLWELPQRDDLVVWWSVFAHSLDRELRFEAKTLDATFSLVPPWRYLRIPRLWIETPIIDVPFAPPEKIESGDFDDELKQWIVKYPFTAKPWEIWNTLFFGHSSVDSFEQAENPFGFIFYALPKLENWDRIEVFWDGSIYEYEVERKQIKWPTQVPEELNKKYDDHQLTLMACYPLLSDAKRILVHAKLLSINGSSL